MFQCGSLKCKLHNIKMNQGLNEPYEIPVPWFLIQHPKGNDKPSARPAFLHARRRD
jgi:N-acyl homoserine lactone hydrolase